jgi:hypothetical protein
MKTKFQGLFAVFFLITTIAVLAVPVPVTFTVDMSGVAGFNPATDIVDVRGTFNNWAGYDSPGGLQLFPSTNPNILTNTYDITDPVGTVEYYKFARNRTFELQGLGNRPFTLQSGAQMLPVVYYNDQPASPSATTNSIRFQVSLATQVTAGNFNPTNDSVSVAGTFQSPMQWVAEVFQLTNSGNNLYIGTFTNDGNYEGTYEEYKFIITHTNYLGYPTYDVWESINNRWFILTNGEILPPVPFNNQGNVVPVTFQVDLGIQATNANRLNPSDVVECKGSFNGWLGGFQLTNNLGGTSPYLFSGTTYIFDNPGTTEYYKFTVNGGYSSLGWESPASSATLDRQFTLTTNAQQVLPSVLWSDWTASDVLPADTVVTFQVSMTNAVRSDGTNFDPANDSVYLNGDWMPWWSWGDTNTASKFLMTNNPVGSGVYSYSLTFSNGYSVPITYKYSINGNDNEAAFTTNHLRYIRTLGNYALPLDTFGNQEHETSFGNLGIAPPSGGKAKITWLGRPGVHLQSANNLAGSIVWQDLTNTVTNTDGTSQTNYPVSSGQKFFRLIKP